MSRKINTQNLSEVDIRNQIDGMMSREEVLKRLQPFSYYDEYEAAVVLDVVREPDHEELIDKKRIVDPFEFPKNYKNQKHTIEDVDFTFIGKIKYRLLSSEKENDRTILDFAYPLETNITEFPLVNEIVLIINILGKNFYTRKLNFKNFLNTNSDFRYEKNYSLNGFLNFDGEQSILDADNKSTHVGSLGKYFVFNKNVRPLKHFEGDTIFQSRFGSSIRFGSYEDVKVVDKGKQTNEVYKNKGGNPKILIRNFQRNLDSNKEENIFGYPILEDINKDGTGFYITSGRTVNFINISPNRKDRDGSNLPNPPINKKMFSETLKEEQINFYPQGASKYKIPEQIIEDNDDDTKRMIGNQAILATDRIIFQSRKNETLHYSKKRYSITTDDEYTVDAHKQIVITTHTKTVLNSPFIYLGQYDETKEPAVLGQTLVEWLYDLCDWLRAHTHQYIHVHTGSGGPGTDGVPTDIYTQEPRIPRDILGVETRKFPLEDLRDRLDDILSRRVFIVGGGYAPGSNGVDISGNDNDTVGKLNDIESGDGVPKQFFGKRAVRGSGLHISNKKIVNGLD